MGVVEFCDLLFTDVEVEVAGAFVHACCMLDHVCIRRKNQTNTQYQILQHLLHKCAGTFSVNYRESSWKQELQLGQLQIHIVPLLRVSWNRKVVRRNGHYQQAT